MRFAVILTVAPAIIAFNVPSISKTNPFKRTFRRSRPLFLTEREQLQEDIRRLEEEEQILRQQIADSEANVAAKKEALESLPPSPAASVIGEIAGVATPEAIGGSAAAIGAIAAGRQFLAQREQRLKEIAEAEAELVRQQAEQMKRQETVEAQRKNLSKLGVAAGGAGAVGLIMSAVGDDSLMPTTPSTLEKGKIVISSQDAISRPTNKNDGNEEPHKTENIKRTDQTENSYDLLLKKMNINPFYKNTEVARPEPVTGFGSMSLPLTKFTKQSVVTNKIKEQEARLKVEEAAKLKEEEEARIAAEQEAARLKAEEARIAAEQEAARIATEQEAARIAAEQEAARVAAEQEAARVAAEQEAARIAAEQEAARIAAEQEAARIAAEQEAARIAAEQEAARIAAEQEVARLKAEEEARITAEQETARLKAEEEARIAGQQENAEVEKKSKVEEEDLEAAFRALKVAQDARKKSDDIALPSLSAPDIALPNIDIPNVDFSKFDLPNMNEIPDAAVVVGGAAASAIGVGIGMSSMLGLSTKQMKREEEIPGDADLLSIDYAAPARLAYSKMSDKSVPFEVFKSKYEAMAVQQVKAKRAASTKSYAVSNVPPVSDVPPLDLATPSTPSVSSYLETVAEPAPESTISSSRSAQSITPTTSNDFDTKPPSKPTVDSYLEPLSDFPSESDPSLATVNGFNTKLPPEPGVSSYLESISDFTSQESPAQASNIGISSNDLDNIPSDSFMDGIFSTTATTQSSPDTEIIRKSYEDDITERCEAGNPTEECMGAITNYLGALSTGDAQPSEDATQGITSYLQSLTTPDTRYSNTAISDDMESSKPSDLFMDGIFSTSAAQSPSSLDAGMTRKYADDITEICEAGNPTPECMGAITNYLGALSSGDAEPSLVATEGIASYLQSLTKSTTTSSSDSPDASSSSGVTPSYLDALTSDKADEPSAASVLSYLDDVKSGKVSIPSSPNELSSSGSGRVAFYLESNSDPSSSSLEASSIPSSTTSSQTAPKKVATTTNYLDEISENCDTSKPTDLCAQAVSKYLDGLANGDTKPSSFATACITYYMDLIGVNTLPDGASSAPAITAYIDLIYSREVLPPSYQDLTSYFNSIIAGQVNAPKSGIAIASYLNALNAGISLTGNDGTETISYLEELIDRSDPASETNPLSSAAPTTTTGANRINNGMNFGLDNNNINNTPDAPPPQVPATGVLNSGLGDIDWVFNRGG